MHTSLLRPCHADTQGHRDNFDSAIRKAGFKLPSDLSTLQTEFNEACATVKKPVKDRACATGYYILNSHGLFAISANRSDRYAFSLSEIILCSLRK